MTKESLAFAIACIEGVADRLGIDAVRVYDALAKKSTLLMDYVVGNYEVLHTQDRQYVVDDILLIMAQKGIAA